jgi:hypothetical protein
VMPAARPSAVRSRSSTSACSTTRTTGEARTGRHERPLHLRAGRVPAGVHDAVAVVAALAGQRQLARRVAVEGGAERDELAQPRRALGAQHPHGVDVAQPDPGDERVLQVLLGAVLGRQGSATPPWAQRVEPSSTSTLVTSRTLPERAACSADRQPGDPGPDDDHVRGGGPAGLGREQARGGDHPASGGAGAGRGSTRRSSPREGYRTCRPSLPVPDVRVQRLCAGSPVPDTGRVDRAPAGPGDRPVARGGRARAVRPRRLLRARDPGTPLPHVGDGDPGVRRGRARARRARRRGARPP